MNSDSTNTPLPYRFRESAFRTYESAIASAVKAYPGVITFNPRIHYSLSPETFACRFRDAVRSLKLHSWPTTLIDRERFLQCCDTLVVSTGITGGLVRIGSKAELNRPNAEVLKSIAHTQEIAAHAAVRANVICLETTNEITLLCKLAAQRLLACEVTCTGITPEMKQHYESNYDVSIQLDPITGIASVL